MNSILKQLYKKFFIIFSLNNVYAVIPIDHFDNPQINELKKYVSLNTGFARSLSKLHNGNVYLQANNMLIENNTLTFDPGSQKHNLHVIYMNPTPINFSDYPVLGFTQQYKSHKLPSNKNTQIQLIFQDEILHISHSPKISEDGEYLFDLSSLLTKYKPEHYPIYGLNFHMYSYQPFEKVALSNINLYTTTEALELKNQNASIMQLECPDKSFVGYYDKTSPLFQHVSSTFSDLKNPLTATISDNLPIPTSPSTLPSTTPTSTENNNNATNNNSNNSTNFNQQLISNFNQNNIIFKDIKQIETEQTEQNPVPEPLSMFTIGVGLTALLKKRKAV